MTSSALRARIESTMAKEVFALAFCAWEDSMVYARCRCIDGMAWNGDVDAVVRERD